MQENFNKPMFPISTIADELKVHQRTLRIYDEENLLVPQRSGKNRRKYSQADIELGKFIQYLTKEMGVNLSGIKIILKLLEKMQIEPGDRIMVICTVAYDLGITLDMQAENKAKLEKRGRKPGVKK